MADTGSMTTRHVYALWAAIAIIACSAILLSASLSSPQPAKTAAACHRDVPRPTLLDIPDTNKPVTLGPVDVPVAPLPC